MVKVVAGGEYIQVLFSRRQTTKLYKHSYFTDDLQKAASIICVAGAVPWLIAGCEVVVGVTITDARHDLAAAADQPGKCFQFRAYVMINVVSVVKNLSVTSVESCQ